MSKEIKVYLKLSGYYSPINIHPFIFFQIFANKVIFWQPLAPLAIVIEDKYLVEMMESILDNLWERAKEE